MSKDEPQILAKVVTLGDVALPLMFDLFAMIRPVKMRWILTGVAAGFLLAVTPASAQDYESIRHAAEQGIARAQLTLGFMYANGEGVPQDAAEAVRWYRLAAEQGHASAQYDLGVTYGTGEGVPQDYTEAVTWYRKAAEQGHADAQFNLGLMYANGEGVPQDNVEAHMWLNLATSRLTGEQRERPVTVRDDLATRMTPADLSEAQRRAREWHAAHQVP